jgi:diacylglycerol kinase
MSRINKHLTSYKYSVRGIWLAFRYEPNMIFHLGAAIVVLVVNGLLKVNQTDWLITLILVGLAWMAEIFNTAIEKLADRVTKEQDPLIGQVKDLAAGAVLIICFFAVVCAAIIYLPYLLKL